MFPGKFQSKNNFKHKVNTLSHPFVSERLTTSFTGICFSFMMRMLRGLYKDLYQKMNKFVVEASHQWSERSC